MTWHPDWKASLDGQPRETAMLSPGFVGIPVPAGRHTVVFRYAPGNWKLWMALAGLLGGADGLSGTGLPACQIRASSNH